MILRQLRSRARRAEGFKRLRAVKGPAILTTRVSALLTRLGDTTEVSLPPIDSAAQEYIGGAELFVSLHPELTAAKRAAAPESLLRYRHDRYVSHEKFTGDKGVT
jgi:hypothetical protein